MTNNENLKSNSERTPKERKELAQKAGMKSGTIKDKFELLKAILPLDKQLNEITTNIEMTKYLLLKIIYKILTACNTF